MANEGYGYEQEKPEHFERAERFVAEINHNVAIPFRGKCKIDAMLVNDIATIDKVDALEKSSKDPREKNMLRHLAHTLETMSTNDSFAFVFVAFEGDADSRRHAENDVRITSEYRFAHQVAAHDFPNTDASDAVYAFGPSRY